MTVTGDDGTGKRVTRDYNAKTPDELRRKHPEAFELFERWTGQAAARGARQADGIRQFGGGFGRRVDVGAEVRDLMLRPGGVGRRIDDDADRAAQQEQIKGFLQRLEEERLEMRRQAEDLEKRVRETERRALEGAREEK
jgi:hypothetical protein